MRGDKMFFAVMITEERNVETARRFFFEMSGIQQAWLVGHFVEEMKFAERDREPVTQEQILWDVIHDMASDTSETVYTFYLVSIEKNEYCVSTIARSIQGFMITPSLELAEKYAAKLLKEKAEEMLREHIADGANTAVSTVH